MGWSGINWLSCLNSASTIREGRIEKMVRIHSTSARQVVWICELRLSKGFSGEGDGTPLQYSCLENPMDRGAWWAAVCGVTKSRTRLSNLTFTFYFHSLEKEMATQSSVLAWRIPGTGEPGGLPSIGSHRVRHDCSDLAAAAELLIGNVLQRVT